MTEAWRRSRSVEYEYEYAYEDEGEYAGSPPRAWRVLVERLGWDTLSTPLCGPPATFHSMFPV